MKYLLTLLLAVNGFAGWQDEVPQFYKEDNFKRYQWLTSPSLWTPAAAAYGTYWAKDGRVVLVIDDGQWAARGYTASTVGAYNAQTVADCAASGGTWSNGDCVYPPPLVPSTEPTPLAPSRVVVDELYLRDLATGSLYGKAFKSGSEITWQGTASPWSKSFSDSNQTVSAQAKIDFLTDLRTARSNLVDITSAILTNITDTQSLVATNFSGAQEKQIKAMQKEQVDSNQQMRQVAAELRKLINALNRLERQQ
jgi:hypothetical protein